MTERKEIVLLSTADWDNPFWTNKQHVALALSKRGFKILYIDSLGLRTPSLNKKDFKRIFKRIVKSASAPRKVRENIWVWSPITLPFNKYRFIRVLNKLFFSLGVKIWSRFLGFKEPWLWTYNPLTTEFLCPQKFSKTIYHCVDEIKAQPGMPIEILEREERVLLTVADAVFVTAPQLKENRKQWNSNIQYFSNVADFDHFNQAVTRDFSIPDDLNNISGPILGFIGAVSGYKVDFELLSFVAKSLPECSIVIIGLVGEGDPGTKIDILTKHENIHLLGPKSYELLPSYLKYFDVALLPNNLNEYTDNMFPMKFFEYLAAGKPMVSVDLSSIKEFEHIVKIAKTPKEFVEAINETLNGNVISLEERLDLAKEYTYESRMDKMLNML